MSDKRLVIYAKVKSNAGNKFGNDYQKALFALRNKFVKIDCKYLFANQLNTTKYIPFSKNGIRLMFSDIHSLYISGRKLDTVKEKIKSFYKDSWKTSLSVNLLKLWDMKLSMLKEYEKNLLDYKNHTLRVIELGEFKEHYRIFKY